MSITKEKKAETLAKLKKIFADSRSVTFVNFHKLTVANAQALRRKLRETGSGYFVAKKSLIEKALHGGAVKGEMPELPGEIAVAYLAEGGDDITAPSREVFGFQKKLEKAVSLVGGIFEGMFKGKEEMVAIASIPSRQTLYAQFVNLVNSPIQGFVVALSRIAEKKQ